MTTTTTVAPNNSPARLLLIALTFTLGLQAIRAFFTLTVYYFGERYGFTAATVPALIVFLAPFLTPLLARLLTPRRALLATVGGLALVRLALQVSPAPELTFALSGLATALALMSVPLGFRWAGSGQTFAVGMVLGLTLDTALHSTFLTWDYLWQRGAVPLVVALVVTGATLYLLWQQRRTIPDQYREPDFRTALPLALLGPYFTLQVLALQNVAFVASVTGLAMPVASALVLLGNAAALFVVIDVARRKPSRAMLTLWGFIGMVAILRVFTNPSGVLVALWLLVLHPLTGGLMTVALVGRAPTQEYSSLLRTSISAGIGSLLFILLAIVYYLAYNIVLPFPNALLPLVAAGLLALAAAVNAPPVANRDWRPAVVPLALLVVPLAVLVTQPVLMVEPVNTNSFRLVNYNIHQAINPGGMVDPEAIAQTIEAQNPQVVVLQEVTRGWAISGSLDVAEWLSRRLQMPYFYAPAADGQFGNAILSSIPVVNWLYEPLPRGGVPMARSFLRADISLGVGEPVTIIATHLHQLEEDTAVRIPQVERLVEVWADNPRTIIAGDMNARPGEDDVTLFESGGLISAQDVTGNAELLTFSSFDPYQRIDWIFGSPDIAFSDFVIPASTASDHLPLAVTVTIEE